MQLDFHPAHTLMVNKMIRQIKLFRQCLQIRMITNHRRDIQLKGTIKHFHQNITQAVGFFGHQHYNLFRPLVYQAAR